MEHGEAPNKVQRLADTGASTARASGSTDMIETLSLDVVVCEILSRLDMSSLYSISLTCRAMHTACRDMRLWKNARIRASECEIFVMNKMIPPICAMELRPTFCDTISEFSTMNALLSRVGKTLTEIRISEGALSSLVIANAESQLLCAIAHGVEQLRVLDIYTQTSTMTPVSITFAAAEMFAKAHAKHLRVFRVRESDSVLITAIANALDRQENAWWRWNRWFGEQPKQTQCLLEELAVQQIEHASVLFSRGPNSMPSLKSLEWFDGILRIESETELGIAAPRLEKLSRHGGTLQSCLGLLSKRWKYAPSVCEALKVAERDHTPKYAILDLLEYKSNTMCAIASLSTLKSLVVKHDYHSIGSDDVLSELSKSTATLTTLRLDYVPNFPRFAPLHLCANLQKLVFKVNDFPRDSLDNIASASCHNTLRKLTVKIGGVDACEDALHGVVSLLSSCPSLNVVSISYIHMECNGASCLAHAILSTQRNISLHLHRGLFDKDIIDVHQREAAESILYPLAARVYSCACIDVFELDCTLKRIISGRSRWLEKLELITRNVGRRYATRILEKLPTDTGFVRLTLRNIEFDEFELVSTTEATFRKSHPDTVVEYVI